MTKLNGLWAGTELGERPIDRDVARMIAKDAYALERLANELRSTAVGADPATAERILARAEKFSAQAGRGWARVDKILDGEP